MSCACLICRPTKINDATIATVPISSATSFQFADFMTINSSQFSERFSRPHGHTGPGVFLPLAIRPTHSSPRTLPLPSLSLSLPARTQNTELPQHSRYRARIATQFREDDVARRHRIDNYVSTLLDVDLDGHGPGRGLDANFDMALVLKCQPSVCDPPSEGFTRVLRTTANCQVLGKQIQISNVSFELSRTSIDTHHC